jgi:hypothetical protein
LLDEHFGRWSGDEALLPEIDGLRDLLELADRLTPSADALPQPIKLRRLPHTATSKGKSRAS